MVRITSCLLRVPVIKFRKGGGPTKSPSASGVSAPSASVSQPGIQAQPAAAMSSASISDIDLPLRYRRRPMSQEEMDYINGGGVV